jgi:hypothetical protein
VRQTQSISDRHVTEDALMASKIEQLPDAKLLHSQLAECAMRIS